MTAWCDADGEGGTTPVKRLEQLEGYVTAFRDEAVSAALLAWVGTSHGAANTLPERVHWFVLTDPLLFAQQPPQGLFPSLGAVGSGLAVGGDGDTGSGPASLLPLRRQPAFVQAARSAETQACQGLGLHGPGLNLAPGTG